MSQPQSHPYIQTCMTASFLPAFSVPSLELSRIGDDHAIGEGNC